MIRPLVTLLLIVGFTIPAGAQEAPLTLELAVATALENNPLVLAAEAEATVASTTRREARGFRLPSVDLTQSYSYTDNPAEVFALTLNQGRFDMNDFFGSDPNAPNALSTFITRLEVTQPIYTGGMIGTRNDQASFMAEAADLDARHTREKVAFETATAFASATKAAEHLTVVRRARDTTAAHVDLASAYAEQGLIVAAEVLNAQVHLARMEEMVAEAEAQVTLAQAALNLHLGLPQTTHHVLAPLPPAPPVQGTAATWIDGANEQRLDLSARRAELEAGRLEEKAARASFWPEVGVKGTYDLYDDTLFGSNGHSGSVMAFARVNLYRGGSDTARTEKTVLATRSGEERIRLFSESVQLETRKAWELRHTAGRRQETAAAAVEAAREALRVREQRFSQGLDKMIDLLDAETALHESELRELVARYDLILSTYQLYFASGSPLATRLGGAAEGDA